MSAQTARSSRAVTPAFLAVVLVALAFAGAPHAQADGDPLPNGWVEVPTGGETICARGAPFSFFYNPGTTSNVIVDFIGGGACWNTDTCDVPNATFTDTVDSVRDMARNGFGGVYDLSRADNPYKNWTHVVIPYCTGDVHWGQADATYTRPDGTNFVIHHRGATNVNAVLAWVKDNYAATAPKVLVTGCSAGAYASAYWTPAIRNIFPNADFRQFGDAGVGVTTDDFQNTAFPLWNVTANAPNWVPGLDPATNDWRKLRLTDFYKNAAAYYPDIKFAQYTTQFDFIQTFFFMRMGGDPDTWTAGMHSVVAELEASTPNFHAFIGPGDGHCATIENDMYTTTVGQTKFVDWLGQLANGDGNVQSVHCDVAGNGGCGQAVH